MPHSHMAYYAVLHYTQQKQEKFDAEVHSQRAVMWPELIGIH